MKTMTMLPHTKTLPEAGKKAWNRSFPAPLEAAWPCCHLDLRLQAFRTVREYVSVVEATHLWYLVMAVLAK